MGEIQDKRLDIVVFGASGYTGKCAVHEVYTLSKEKNFSWGIAGRSEAKLRGVIREISEKSGEDLSKIKIMLADISNEASLLNMAAQARVIANCVGPYRFFGEPIIKACIACGTHHVDISGEPQYMERMQLKYHKAAEDKGVYIVSACGFDSIPADMGTVFLQDKFGGTVNSVETFLECQFKGPTKGSAINYATWESAVHGFAHRKELAHLRRKLFPKKLPQFTPKLKLRPTFDRNGPVQGWNYPFPGSDRSVMKRSQRHFYDNECQRPAHVETYMVFQSLYTVFITFAIGTIIGKLCRYQYGRSLLLAYPRVFSFGLVSHEGPSKEVAENTMFSMILQGEGWKEKLSEPTDQYKEPVNKKMTVKVSGRNPGYGATSTMLLMSAYMCLTESEKMPSKGGVYSPGAAFAKTSLIQHLHQHNVKFHVISSL